MDLEGDYPEYVVANAINAKLRPLPVCVLSAQKVEASFHARFSAIRRQYHYRIINRRAPLVLEKNRAWFVPVPLDIKSMQEAASVLVGHHDFTSFRATACQSPSPFKTLERFEVTHQGELIEACIEARSFLHNQVRIMMGSIVKVGRGDWSVDDIRQALAARHRPAGGPTAPPEGLYLTKVFYPPTVLK